MTILSASSDSDRCKAFRLIPWRAPRDPVQKPHPPIVLGGAFPHAAKRAIAHGDGWIPIGGRALDPLEVLRNSDKWQRMPAAIPLAHLQRLWGAPRPGGSETLP
jgi:hypothetical protein